MRASTTALVTIAILGPRTSALILRRLAVILSFSFFIVAVLVACQAGHDWWKVALFFTVASEGVCGALKLLALIIDGPRHGSIWRR